MPPRAYAGTVAAETVPEAAPAIESGTDALPVAAPAGGTDTAGPTALADLSWQARYADRDDARLEAVTALTQYRDGTAVEALLEAASDPVAAVRFRAVQALGLYVADGLDTDGRLVAVLQQARLDPEPQVAALAERWVRSAED